MGTRTILGGVGFVVGAYYGNPQLGYFIGATIGGIVDPQVIKGPALGDIAEQTSQEGVPIPIVYGESPPIAGNIIACSPPIYGTSKSGGKGGPVVKTQTVSRTYAIRFCEGPVGGFVRVWRNNTKVYDLYDPDFSAGSTARRPAGGHGFIDDYVPSKNEYFLYGPYDQGEPSGAQKVHFFNGTYDQNASPDLEAVFGAGTTPAHRGIAYMVVADEDLTAEGGMVPYYLAQVSNATITPILSNEVLYPWVSGDTYPVNPLNTNKYRVESYSNGTPDSSIAATDFNSKDAALNAITAFNARYGAGLEHFVGYCPRDYEAPINATADCRLQNNMDGPTPTPLTDANKYTFRSVYLAYGTVVGIESTPTLVYGQELYSANPTAYANGSKAFTLGFTVPNGLNNRQGKIVQICPSPTPPYPYESTITDGSSAYGEMYYSTAHIRVVRSPGAPDIPNVTQITGTFKVLKTFNPAVSDYPKPLNPCLALGDPAYDAKSYWDQAYALAVTAGDIESGRTYSASGTGDPLTTYPHVVTTAWQGDGVSVGGRGIPLPQLVEAICARAGIASSKVEASLLDADTVVTGFPITNQYPASQAIQALGLVYKFDATKYDGKIRFVPRGGNSVATITEADMVDSDDDIEESKRADSISVPRVLHLSYYDESTGGLSTSQQSSERAGDRRAVGEVSLQTAVVMSADLAAQTVAVAHKVMAEDQKGELNIQLPDSFIGLVPSDPIIVQWNGRSERVRIEEVDTLDGYQTYVGRRDRQSAYTSNVEGIPQPPPLTPPSNVQGPTIITPLDIPLLRDADDNAGLGYYVAVCGATSAWKGCTVELSYDNGATYINSKDGPVASVMGLLTSSLDDHPADCPDVTHSFTVALSTPGASLASSTLAGMLNRANLAAVGSPEGGWELINFAAADEIDPATRQWSISSLLRGRKHTAPRAHAIDEYFVLLNRNLLGFEAASVIDLGRTLTFRATTSGQPSSGGTVVSMVFTGQVQTEYSPAYLKARRSGSDMIAAWQGVGRLGGGAAVAEGVRFTGYRVTFNDGTNVPIVVDTTAQTLSADLSSLGLDVPQLGALAFTGDGDQNLQRVMVIGGQFYATVGSGSAGSITATLRRYSQTGVQLASHALDGSSRVFDAISADGYIFVAYSKGPSDYSRLSRIDPSTLLEVDHQSAAFATYQGVAYDGTWLYGSRNGASEVARFDTASFGEDSNITVPTPGRMSYAAGKLFAIAGANVSIIDTATFAEDSTFATVSNPLDIMATDDLVFVQGRYEMGVYTRTGTLVATYANAATITYEYQKFLATDGYRVFRPNDTGIEFFSGSTGALLAMRIEGAGPIGGFAGGYYIASQGIPEAMDGADTNFYASTAGIRVSVVQLNSLTGAGPAIEVIA